MKGRKIVGALVPYGQVWRTGANKATALSAEADLMKEVFFVGAETQDLSSKNKFSFACLIKKRLEEKFPGPGR